MHWRGGPRLTFNVPSAEADVIPLLIGAAPAVNYFGKHGSFVQYLGARRLDALDASFTWPFRDGAAVPLACHRAVLEISGRARASTR